MRRSLQQIKELRTIFQACCSYFLYIIEHKLNVLIECWHEGLYIQGIIHDWSKFTPQEFFPYARKFYLKQNNNEINRKWDKAWQHHQKYNKHHWEHWVVDEQTKESLPMPKKYMIEMVCDWRSFSRKWGRKVKKSYLLERMLDSNDVILHPETRKELEEWITKS